ncbi:hypothetical protein [Kitasatospora paracochleata]|uniref:Uncharacterized protein n=1 Tax=Kitasatospora paracochleata TaxID=58354 RepID=A0ABT1J345_9ACTN|nr:hypothetical protein [Kitasatospora paracochleata]MCP2311852.1 hypothetical protein [Kitasatospora paracochleata]
MRWAWRASSSAKWWCRAADGRNGGAGAATLALELPGEAEVLTRLREVATGVGRDYLLVFTPEGNPYHLLIGG